MMNFKNSVILLVMSALFSGCAATTPIFPKVSESEAFKYEKGYLAEYESLKKDFPNSSKIKWIQPSNKNEPCKVYTGMDENAYRNLGENFKMFWDGDCKAGYAYGLGREFSRDTVSSLDALAIYQGTSAKPQYYIKKYNLENATEEGDLNNGYYVKTQISDDVLDFQIIIWSGFFGSQPQSFSSFTMSSPFVDEIYYWKQYPNFAYKIVDYSNHEFAQSKYQFNMLDADGNGNGFGFTTPKHGQVTSGEQIDGKIIRRIRLPDSYFTKIDQIYNEIIQATQKANNAQKEALRVKKQYMNKICRDSVQVNFIDNSEYKSICNESSNNDLKEKIENTFARINSQKQQYREQLNRQKVIDAQVAQANAAQRQANAQEQQNLNNQIQELGRSLQQTNSYSWTSMPASKTTYQPYNSNTRKIKNCFTASGIEFCN